MLAPNTLIDAQHRRQDTGERAPPPQSHWRRAWARTQPTLDDKTERRLLHAGLQFQNAMKALDQEQQAILEQHRDISSPAAAQQLEERLQQVLARYQATALTQHLFTIFTPTSAMCWVGGAAPAPAPAPPPAPAQRSAALFDCHPGAQREGCPPKRPSRRAKRPPPSSPSSLPSNPAARRVPPPRDAPGAAG
ncbi:hypothetical protein MNEG_15673 [Monoraphidium neglectum]|uniref:Uncharacterized protein n=1 Tax=Monoraphidium neglectum TaxID=145388 RepID=A0A0D2MA88_9CHLO|nr:hypothetical protein MNEG_15673 [Monoraphidium neglectum]KIY92290.1 hypothetical protein MNEG_15673 [Monoraphidium neglectum]|eukprot:XP_013891310.1 hypothetical protein MNEG_15673 [Monoraphidium neglectum]